jgi:hypothetical protein
MKRIQMIDRTKLVGFIAHASVWMVLMVMGTKLFAADFSIQKGENGQKDVITVTGDFEDCQIEKIAQGSH